MGTVELKWAGTDQKFVAQINNMEKATPKMLSNALKEAGELLLLTIKSKAPENTGKYKNSWKIAEITDKSVIIRSPENELFKILEFTGSQGGYREAKNAKALHWVDESGQDVFVKWSNPTGFKNIPHLRPSIQQFKKILPFIIEKHIGKSIPMFRQGSQDAVSKVEQYRQKVSRA
jgi:hypothetical protein